MTIVTKVRISYAQTFKPKDSFGDGKLAYSATFLIDKNDKEKIKQIEEAIDRATKLGVQNGKFKATAPKLPNFKNPLRDGDAERKLNPDGRGPEYEGMMFFNARNTNPVGNVNKANQPIRIEDQEGFYSGWYVHADVNFYPFNSNGSSGVAAGLNNIMWLEAGERLDGRRSAQEAFAGLEVEDDTTPSFE